MWCNFLEVGGVQTRVAAWGGWHQEELPPEVIICIPGNPGLAGFYYNYLEKLHATSNLPVWILGHAGHEEPTHWSPIVTLKGQERLFDLPGQLYHKLDFLKRYTKPSTRVHLVGHSVGGWMAMELLKSPLIRDRIVSVNLLFPTLQNIATTRNGLFLNGFIRRITFIVIFLTFIFSKLPLFLEKILLFAYFFLMNIPYSFCDNVLKFICPSVVEKVLFMAYSQMDLIIDLDVCNLKSNAGKVKIIFNSNDGWAPGKHFEELLLLAPSLHIEEVPYSHLFVFLSSAKVASITARLIKSAVVNLS